MSMRCRNGWWGGIFDAGLFYFCLFVIYLAVHSRFIYARARAARRATQTSLL